jgi:cation:H+ antiporter
LNITDISSIAGGLILLFIGAEGLIRGGSSLALRFGISPLVVGLTVIAFGTSSPELVVSLKAAMENNSGIAIGNVVGSNICNIALILGLSAVIKPMKVESQVIKQEIPIMVAVTILFIIFLQNGIARIEGLILTIGIIAYTAYGVISSKKEQKKIKQEFEEGIKPQKNIFLSLVFTIAGLAMLILGSNFFVNGAIAAAESFGVSQLIIGLTIVAIGTSLPELFTSVVASVKGNADIAIGNVIGSNIFNVLAIIGITALIAPMGDGGINLFDLGVLFLVSVLIWPLSFTGFTITRWEGAFLIAGYVAYMIYLMQ